MVSSTESGCQMMRSNGGASSLSSRSVRIMAICTMAQFSGSRPVISRSTQASTRSEAFMMSRGYTKSWLPAQGSTRQGELVGSLGEEIEKPGRIVGDDAVGAALEPAAGLARVVDGPQVYFDAGGV